MVVAVMIMTVAVPAGASAATNYYSGYLGGNGYTNAGVYRQIAYMSAQANHNSYCVYRATSNYLGAPSASNTEYCATSGGYAYQSFHCFSGYPASHNRHSFGISVSGTNYESCGSARTMEPPTAGDDVEVAIDRTADTLALDQSSVTGYTAADDSETFAISGPKRRCVAAEFADGLGMGCGADDAHAIAIERSTIGGNDRVVGLVPAGVVNVRAVGEKASVVQKVSGRRSFSISGVRLAMVEFVASDGTKSSVPLD